jgi:hypothetical protein
MTYWSSCWLGCLEAISFLYMVIYQKILLACFKHKPIDDMWNVFQVSSVRDPQEMYVVVFGKLVFYSVMHLQEFKCLLSTPILVWFCMLYTIVLN